MKPTEKKFDSNPNGTLINKRESKMTKIQLYNKAKLHLPSPDFVVSSMKSKFDHE